MSTRWKLNGLRDRRKTVKLGILVLVASAVLSCGARFFTTDSPNVKPIKTVSEPRKYLTEYTSYIVDAFEKDHIDVVELNLSLERASLYKMIIEVASVSKAEVAMRRDMQSNMLAIRARKRGK